MLKNRTKQKITFIVMFVLICVSFSIVSCTKDNKNAVENEESIPTNEDVSGETTDGGGNPYKDDEYVVITVLVNQDEYIYDNNPIEFNELIEKITETEGVIVEVRDNNATYKSYDKLIKKLVELEIKYTEK